MLIRCPAQCLTLKKDETHTGSSILSAGAAPLLLSLAVPGSSRGRSKLESKWQVFSKHTRKINGWRRGGDLGGFIFLEWKWPRLRAYTPTSLVCACFLWRAVQGDSAQEPGWEVRGLIITMTKHKGLGVVPGWAPVIRQVLSPPS